MMDLSMVITFALLQISIQPDSTHSIPVQDTSVTKRADLQDKSLNEFHSNLKWEEMKALPEDAVSIFDKKLNKWFYVARFEDCTPCFYDSDKKACLVMEIHSEFNLGHTTQNKKISILVNKDKFEILEWKKSSYGEIPPLPVETCNGYFIARNEFGIGYLTENSLLSTGGKKQDSTENEVLTLNYNIKGHHLIINKFEIDNMNTSKTKAVLKHFTAYNKNHQPAKYQVKLEQGTEQIVSLQKTLVKTFGGTGELSVKGNLVIVDGGLKVSPKYEYNRLISKTTSTNDKNFYSVSMEVEVPANHSCSIDIISNTFTAEVPFIGELTRMYKNNEIRRTLISDHYILQEVAEIQALVNSCKKVLDVEI